MAGREFDNLAENERGVTTREDYILEHVRRRFLSSPHERALRKRE